MSAWSAPWPAQPLPAVCLPGDAFETSSVNFEPLRERRREVRYPTYEEVRVSLLDVAGLEVSGVLRDVSRSGFRVELILPVRTGGRVKVTIPGKVVIFATVRYCRSDNDTFQVGASIDAMFCPSALLVARAPERYATPNLNQSLGAASSGVSAGECRDIAQCLRQGQAVDVRQRQILDDQVGTAFGQLRDCGAAIFGLLDFVAVGRQR